MESKWQQDTGSNSRPRRRVGGFHFGLLAGALFFGLSLLARADDAIRIRPTLYSFLHDMPRTVRPDHPAILPVAAAIRAVTADPLEQLVMVNDVTHLLVDYDDDQRVYGLPEFYATLDQMLAKRRQQGWLYLRDDCDGRAVFAAHLLASLGIHWQLAASYWKGHAWVIARVSGIDYDLLDFHPDAARPKFTYRLIGHWFVHASRPPPPFDWRHQWAERTNHDLITGLRLGLLALDSTSGHFHERWATDWTKQSPLDRHSPVDPRALAVACAGFPFGEMLNGIGLAITQPGLPADPSPAPTPATETDAAVPEQGLAGNSSPESPASPLVVH